MPENRFNDGKCDPAGRFWAGTINMNSLPAAGALYRLDQDLSVHKILDKVSISNGLIWNTAKQKMYYIDTPTCKNT
ncbi:SMP-30/gluconolactonase/LRE family protein [Verrucomicrobiota bacterium]